MIDSLISSPTTRMLEQTLSFTEQRHNLLLDNIANVDTPGYVERDVPVEAFQATLRQAVEERRASPNDTYDPQSTNEVTFQPGGSNISIYPHETPNSVVFHDRGIRRMEFLMSELADNALAHNMTAQLLRNRYDTITKAISMKV